MHAHLKNCSSKQMPIRKKPIPKDPREVCISPFLSVFWFVWVFLFSFFLFVCVGFGFFCEMKLEWHISTTNPVLGPCLVEQEKTMCSNIEDKR